MARRNKKGGRPSVKRTLEHFHSVRRGDLQALDALATAYDSGSHKVATAMANLIHNIVSAGDRAAQEERGNLTFPSPDQGNVRVSMSPVHRLVGLRTGNGRADFMAYCQMPPGCSAYVFHPFRIWWRTEPIYVASISLPSLPLDVIALRPEDQLSWDDREKLTREQLVTEVRNTLSAHSDEEIAAAINDLYKSESFGLNVLQGHPDQPGPPVEVGCAPIEAALRQIAEEVLIAYGVRSMP